MATVNKNFRIKHGLVVEGTTGTINGQNILTETGSDQYILDLVGGANLIDSVASGLDITDTVLSIDRTVVDTWYDASGAASSAQTAAESYADSLASNYDAAGAASTAESNANSYTDTALESYTPTSSLDTAVGGYGYLKSADLSGYATESYVGQAITDLVDGAPDLLNTLNELAQAIDNDASYASTLTTALGNKQDTVTAGDGLDFSGATLNLDLISSGGLNIVAGQAGIDRTTVDSWYDASGAAATAESSANSYTDTAISNGNVAATPTYGAVNIGYYTELVSGWQSTSNGGTFVPLTWSTASWGTAKLTVHVRSGNHSQASEILLARDSSNNIAITEYAIVTTNGILADVTADVVSGNTRILVAPTTGHDQTEAVVSGSIIAFAD